MKPEPSYRPLPDTEQYRLRADAKLLLLQGSQSDASEADAAAEKSGENYLKSVILANGAALIALVGLVDKLKSISPELTFSDLKLSLAFYASGLMAAIISFAFACIGNYLSSEENHTVYSMMTSSLDGLDELAKQFEGQVGRLRSWRRFWACATMFTASIAGVAFLGGSVAAWLIIAK